MAKWTVVKTHLTKGLMGQQVIIRYTPETGMFHAGILCTFHAPGIAITTAIPIVAKE